ncbi:MAG TPA: hypothetical protein VFZ19_07925 [Solirubrobacterales bacterium]
MKEPVAVGDEILEIEREGLESFKVKRLYVGYRIRSAPSSSGVAFPLSRSELDAVRLQARKEGRSFSDAIRAELKRRMDS